MSLHLSVSSNPLFHKTTLAAWRCWRSCKSKLHSSIPYGSSGSDHSDKLDQVSSVWKEKPPHVPVMLKEVLQYLDVKPGQVVLDMTFGGGGHAEALLSAVPGARLLALDRDPAAVQLAHRLAQRYPGRVTPLLGRFSELESLLSNMKVKPGSIDGVLLDAGCSSMQMDEAQRGFSLSKDGPLDMRMDADRFPEVARAADVVNTLDARALASILAAYGEERHAARIAAAVVEARRLSPIAGTQRLASVVAGSFPAVHARKDRLGRPAHVATKTFQALRIFVNDELKELLAGLAAAQTALRPGGRLCVLTFHSLEDRIVKRFLRGDDLSNLERELFSPRKAAKGKERRAEGSKDRGSWAWLPLTTKVLTPEKDDVKENPRGRSAKLRAALKR